MASTSAALSITSTSTFADSKAPRQPTAVSSLQCTGLPALHQSLEQPQNRPSRETWRPTAYCRKLARNVITMATGEAPTEVVATETPEIVKTIQEAWDKVEDKYAVTSLAVAGVVALWGSAGMISAIDRLPLIPGVLELVGIGYTGWFAYKNLVFTRERQALVGKIKDTYKDIIGSNLREESAADEDHLEKPSSSSSSYSVPKAPVETPSSSSYSVPKAPAETP